MKLVSRPIFQIFLIQLIIISTLCSDDVGRSTNHSNLYSVDTKNRSVLQYDNSKDLSSLLYKAYKQENY